MKLGDSLPGREGPPQMVRVPSGTWAGRGDKSPREGVSVVLPKSALNPARLFAFLEISKMVFTTTQRNV